MNRKSKKKIISLHLPAKSKQISKHVQKLSGNLSLDDIPPSERISQPLALLPTLLPHQTLGLMWMIHHETIHHGGVLADEMGLGKTIQTLALILSRPIHSPLHSSTACTLIVVPSNLISLWIQELNDKIRPCFNFSYFVYSTKHRHLPPSFFSKHCFNVIITSYSTLSADYAYISSKGSLTPIHSHRWERIILDEAQTIRNTKTITAKSVLDLNAKFRWCLTGTPFQNNIRDLYSILAFLRIQPYDEWEKFKKMILVPVAKGNSILAEKRITAILSSICLRRTKTMDIDGCPILKLSQKTSHLIKVVLTANERNLYEDLKMKSNRIFAQIKLDSNNMSHLLVLILRLRQVILDPRLVFGDASHLFMKQESPFDSFHDLLQHLKNDQLECFTCLALSSSGCLSSCGHTFCNECAKPESKMCGLCDTETQFIDLGELQKTWRERERNERLRLYQARKATRGVFQKFMENQEWYFDCSCGIYGDNYDDGNLMVACDECAVWQHAECSLGFDSGDGFLCEVCFKKFSRDLSPGPTHHLSTCQSSKANTAFELIKSILNAKCDDKVVVFSQFSSWLFLLGDAFKKEFSNTNISMFHGDLSEDEKETQLLRFKHDPETRVILMSLRCGALGLNLTAANHLILMDNWWNPAMEMQAVDRIYRIGQLKDVHIYKLIVENTIEEKIETLQKQKIKLLNLMDLKLGDSNPLGLTLGEISNLIE